MQKISPFLWFAHEAEEAANFYVSVFKDSKLGKIVRYDAPSAKGSGMPEGSMLTVGFELEGQQFTALNGGPHFKFTEAISLLVSCDTQEEIDYYWEKLSAVPASEQCGWLKDKYGLSWQIAPRMWPDLISDPSNPEGATRAMAAMMQMKKLDIAALKAAYDGA